MSKRVPVRIWDWDNYGTTRVRIRKNGTINKSAMRAFHAGQCHSLALAIHALTGWAIYGIVGKGDTEKSPAHIVVRNPRNKGFIDIGGYGAITRWRKRHGQIAIILLKPEDIYKFDSYLIPNIKAAMPFARKVLEGINIKV